MLGHFVFTDTFVLSILLVIRKEECDRKWLYQYLLSIAIKCKRLNLSIFPLECHIVGATLYDYAGILCLQMWTSKIIGLKVWLFPDCDRKWFYQYLLSIAVK